MNLRILTLDFETYYGDDYTLSKMTTEGYVRDPMFQTIGIGVFEPATGERLWMAHDVFTYWTAQQDWSNTALICHHAQFDGLILAHHYNIRPRFWFCTLSMARPIHGTGKISLAKLGETYGVGVKGDDVVKAKGKRFEHFSQPEWTQYGNYCLNDCQLTYEIFIRMLQHFSREELELIDLTIRMFTEPAFILDAPLLEQGVRDEIAAKEILLSKAETSKDVLMSNDKFAALLFDLGAEVPQKISPASLKPDKNGVLGDPKYTWAFAKTDPGFKKLLEHEDDAIRWVAEARVGVKSTLKETRSQRLAEMAHRGLAPVYLNYAGAHTGRWSGGDKVNLQNLPRKGILRKAVLAPDGYVVVVCDSAQIEARTLAWLASHESLVEAFAQGRDVYSEQATIIYQRPINRKRKEIVDGKEIEPDFVEGFIGKTCLSGETQVLCDKGWKRITEVTQKDRLWDGEEWVCHKGLVQNGWKETQQIFELWLTPDHLVFTGESWKAAQSLEQDQHALYLALAHAAVNLPSLGIYLAFEAAYRTYLSPVIAGVRSILSIDKTSKNSNPRAATSAPKKRRQKNAIGSIQRLCQMTRTALDCSIAWLRLSLGATLLHARYSPITADAALQFAKNGGTIEPLFSNTCRPLKAGITQHLKWIAQTTRGVMNQATFGLLRAARMHATGAVLDQCRRKLKVYDIACAGPRNRFTVRTNAGPLIVHNCTLGLGYGMGWPKFAGTVLQGANGGPPVLFDKATLESMHIDPNPFLNNPKNVEKAMEIPTKYSQKEMLIHCIVAKYIVDTYRGTNAPIPKFWDLCSQMIDSMYDGCNTEWLGGLIQTRRNELVLPSGRVLRYRELECGKGKQYKFKNGREWTKLYGGLLCENITQAVARDLVARQALEYAKTGRKVASTTHDEVQSVVQTSDGATALNVMLSIMKRPQQSWAQGVPLSAEGGFARVYADAKP